jgi:hypothetical protein
MSGQVRALLVGRDGTVTGELADPTQIGWEQALGGMGGSATVSTSLDDPLLALGPLTCEPWAAELLLMRQDPDDPNWADWRPVFYGPIAQVTCDIDATSADSPSVQIKALPALSWLDRRVCTRDVTWKSWRADAIARDLLARATAGYGSVGAVHAFGVTADRSTMPRIDHAARGRDQKTYATLLRDLARWLDFREEVTWDGENAGRTLLLVAPRISTRITTPLQLGVTLTKLSVNRPTTTTRTYVGGADHTVTYTVPAPHRATKPQDRHPLRPVTAKRTVQLTAAARNPALEVVYGALEHAETDTNAATQAAADALAAARLAALAPRWILNAGFIPGPGLPIDLVRPGDSVRIQAQRGWVSVDGWRRVTQVAVSVDQGSETVTLSTVEPADDAGDTPQSMGAI